MRLFALLLTLIFTHASAQLPTPKPKSAIGARHPSISPSSKEIVFVYRGDIWKSNIDGKEARPITLGIQALRGRWTSAWQLISAASLIVALPPVILFFKLQKHFIAGLTMGAVKE